MLGSGATGVVRAGWDPALGVAVAIKQLSPSYPDEPGFLRRFRTEAEMLVGLADPNVVSIYDHFEVGGNAYLVMELVEGPSLRAVLATYGRLAPEEALGAMAGALKGLGHVHARGVIHRDVKPDNVLLDVAGVSKLVDFGLAGTAGVVAGTPIGTPAYVSPEAIRGDEVDARSDLYSSGAVLYELLAGRPPFAAATTAGLLALHLRADPPALPRVPAALARLCAAALAKDADRRPQSAAEMLARLEQAAREGYGVDWMTRSSLAAVVAAVTAAKELAVGGTGAAGAATGGAEIATAAVSATAAVPAAAIPAAAAVGAGAATAGVVHATHLSQLHRRAGQARRAARLSSRAAGRHGVVAVIGTHPVVAAVAAVAITAAASVTVVKTKALNVFSSGPAATRVTTGTQTHVSLPKAPAATAPSTTTVPSTTSTTASVALAKATFAATLSGYGQNYETSGVVITVDGPIAFVAFSANDFFDTPMTVDVLRFVGGTWHRDARLGSADQASPDYFPGPPGAPDSVSVGFLTGSREPDALLLGEVGAITHPISGVVVSLVSGTWGFVPFHNVDAFTSTTTYIPGPSISGSSIIEKPCTVRSGCASPPYRTFHYDATAKAFV